MSIETWALFGIIIYAIVGLAIILFCIARLQRNLKKLRKNLGVDKKRIFNEFEPERWQDIALIPWWLLRYVFVWCWFYSWWGCRIIKLYITLWGEPRQGFFWFISRPGSGRHTDVDPVMCPRCLWAGPVRWMVHTYFDDGSGESEPIDECPRCGWGI